MKLLYLIATTPRKSRSDLFGKASGWKPIVNATMVTAQRRLDQAGDHDDSHKETDSPRSGPGVNPSRMVSVRFLACERVQAGTEPSDLGEDFPTGMSGPCLRLFSRTGNASAVWRVPLRNLLNHVEANFGAAEHREFGEQNLRPTGCQAPIASGAAFQQDPAALAARNSLMHAQ